MKKILSTLVALVCATAMSAQMQSDIRTATLIHGDKTSVFYGQGAFASAYNASADGDVIVLSSGYFDQSEQIRKSLTIYGAGYETDTISGAAPTHISKIMINYNEDYDDYGEKVKTYPTVRLEGLLLDNSAGTGWNADHQPSLTIWGGGNALENLVVRKCKIHRVGITPASKNCKFSQCVIEMIGHTENSSVWGYSFYYGLNQEHQNLNFENCWINEAEGGSLSSTINYDHCIISSLRNSGYGNYAHFTNNILNGTLLENCTAHNCIFTTSSTGNNVTTEGCWTEAEIAAIFTDASQGFAYSATNDFKLRFPKKYVGTDGTEVGINGGNAPFDRISPIPRILSSDIDIRTTNEGKLKVNLKVQAQTKE